MACDLETILESGCSSGILRLTSEIELLQVIAQLLAEQLLVADPEADISVNAITARACTSGIGKVIDPITLLQIAAQNGCELSP